MGRLWGDPLSDESSDHFNGSDKEMNFLAATYSFVNAIPRALLIQNKTVYDDEIGNTRRIINFVRGMGNLSHH